jgi:pyridinium-3,5-biscarboxylic acid mononucleotide synthase
MDKHPTNKDKKPGKSPANHEWLVRILEKVKSGDLSTAQAVQELSILPYEEMNFAKVDHHRSLRVGFPEVILGMGKTTEQIIAIAGRLIAHSEKLLITRVNPDVYIAVKEVIHDAKYNPASKTIVVNRRKKEKLRPGIAVVTGGTADIPVAEEAAVIAELMGNKVEKIFDVGIAGIHRLLDKVSELRKARVLVVVAGMEGALPSVLGGLVSVPVIAVPTSIGYGASFNGLAPLLTMLNTCAPGVAVVNIDNGFGAGYLAGLINLPRNGLDDKEDENRR